MFSRKGLIGINNVNSSCWLASTLQAIVDCPPLLDIILTFERHSIDQVTLEGKKKKKYFDLLKKLKKFLETSTSQQIDIENIKCFNDLLTETLLRENEYLGSTKTLEQIILENNLPNTDQINTYIPASYNLNDQEELTYDTNIIFWGSIEFDVELRKYLYALATYNPTDSLCLDPTALRNTLLKMKEQTVLFYTEFNNEFVKNLGTSEKLTFFLSIIFENLTLIGISKNTNLELIFSNESQKIEDRYIHKLITFNERIKFGYTKYTMQELIAVSESLHANFKLQDFIIIESSEIFFLESHNHIVTEKRIIIDGTMYVLCSVIIYCGKGHYRTITTKGQFDDAWTLEGPSYLDDFCRKGYSDRNKVDGDTLQHPGLLWFYKKEYHIELNADLDQFTENLQVCHHGTTNHDTDIDWNPSMIEKLGSLGIDATLIYTDPPISPIKFVELYRSNSEEKYIQATQYVEAEINKLNLNLDSKRRELHDIELQKQQEAAQQLANLELFKRQENQKLQKEKLEKHQLTEKIIFLKTMHERIFQLEKELDDERRHFTEVIKKDPKYLRAIAPIDNEIKQISDAIRVAVLNKEKIKIFNDMKNPFEESAKGKLQEVIRNQQRELMRFKQDQEQQRGLMQHFPEQSSDLRFHTEQSSDLRFSSNQLTQDDINFFKEREQEIKDSFVDLPDFNIIIDNILEYTYSHNPSPKWMEMDPKERRKKVETDYMIFKSLKQHSQSEHQQQSSNRFSEVVPVSKENMLPVMTISDLDEEQIDGGIRKIYKYFKKVNIYVINAVFGTEYEGNENESAFDYFKNNYRQYSRFKLNDKFSQMIESTKKSKLQSTHSEWAVLGNSESSFFELPSTQLYPQEDELFRRHRKLFDQVWGEFVQENNRHPSIDEAIQRTFNQYRPNVPGDTLQEKIDYLFKYWSIYLKQIADDHTRFFKEIEEKLLSERPSLPEPEVVVDYILTNYTKVVPGLSSETEKEKVKVTRDYNNYLLQKQQQQQWPLQQQQWPQQQLKVVPEFPEAQFSRNVETTGSADVLGSNFNPYLSLEEKENILRIEPQKILEMFPNFREDVISKTTFADRLFDSSIVNKERISAAFMSGGYSHSKQQKYLKYKNKYLQLKRMEKK